MERPAAENRMEANAMLGESGTLLSAYHEYYTYRPERWCEEGRTQGRLEGRIEAQAELIREMASEKFDLDTGDALSRCVYWMSDPELGVEFGEWVVECEDAGALLDRAKRVEQRVASPRRKRHDRKCRAFDPERAREGETRERARAEGRFEGRDKGHVEVIRRAAARKFSPETVQQLVKRVESIHDADWIAEIGREIIECDDGKDLLKRTERPKWGGWWNGSPSHAMRKGWADGRAEGWVDGWARGQVDGQVSLLRWQTAWKFDIETAERLTEWLVEIVDLIEMHQVSEWLIKCESGEELLERMEVRFGAPVSETVTEWAERWLEKRAGPWLEEGRAKARSDAMYRMAARKFGSETADRLAERLADVSDPWRVDKIGKWLLECENGEWLLGEVARLCESSDAGDGAVTE